MNYSTARSAAECLLLARSGHGPMSDLSPLSGDERKSNFGAVRSVDDPACVKTRLSQERAELFSQLPSPQRSGGAIGFPQQRN
jgi:hypothetical protein